MSVELIDAPSAPGVRVLLLVWQNPRTHQFVKVARLKALSGGYRFEYLEQAKDPAFEPLHSFPELDRVYSTEQLPAFFQNRVMSRKRGSYDQYAGWLGIDPTIDAPVEVLARTGGGRATDTFHVVEEPVLLPGRSVIVRFFASGLRHIDGALGRLLTVRQGDRLTIRPEPGNPVDSAAVLIDSSLGESVGWVPNWLLDDIHQLMNADDFSLCVDQINFDAPWHLKLLCRLEATSQ